MPSPHVQRSGAQLVRDRLEILLGPHAEPDRPARSQPLALRVGAQPNHSAQLTRPVARRSAAYGRRIAQRHAPRAPIRRVVLRDPTTREPGTVPPYPETEPCVRVIPVDVLVLARGQLGGGGEAVGQFHGLRLRGTLGKELGRSWEGW